MKHLIPATIATPLSFLLVSTTTLALPHAIPTPPALAADAAASADASASGNGVLTVWVTASAEIATVTSTHTVVVQPPPSSPPPPPPAAETVAPQTPPATTPTKSTSTFDFGQLPTPASEAASEAAPEPTTLRTMTTMTTSHMLPPPPLSSFTGWCDYKFCVDGMERCMYWAGFTSYDISRGPLPGEVNTYLGPCST